MAGVLFEDIFDVKDIDPEGKKFDRGGGWRIFVFSSLFSVNGGMYFKIRGISNFRKNCVGGPANIFRPPFHCQ
ncbi:DNA-directed RNA polymerases I, II, and III subunit RPABC3 [Orchesella cincta]|uniref:DNA-directed RNA polymerases I, II, and III subunit RPABC3 n=1 Tax=Orchesella cincta TaxID=48709 RepID=A0A1D2N531_ORCCI|nr:DNA-directed RNA polymerases I, II, and III subunit RPABC3 [Orchesella cincta]